MTALTTDLNGSDAVQALAANGPYDAATDTLSADQLPILLSD